MQSIAFQNQPATCFMAADTRADGAARQVSVEREGISISRRFMGIDMRVGVPITAYTGVVLRHEALETGCFEVTLEHSDPDLSVTLWRADADALSVETVWRSWAAYLQLPAFRDNAESPDERAPIATASTLRRHRDIGPHRRPRFLQRRKPGALQRMSIVHKDEELISYE